MDISGNFDTTVTIQSLFAHIFAAVFTGLKSHIIPSQNFRISWIALQHKYPTVLALLDTALEILRLVLLESKFYPLLASKAQPIRNFFLGLMAVSDTKFDL